MPEDKNEQLKKLIKKTAEEAGMGQYWPLIEAQVNAKLKSNKTKEDTKGNILKETLKQKQFTTKKDSLAALYEQEKLNALRTTNKTKPGIEQEKLAQAKYQTKTDSINAENAIKTGVSRELTINKKRMENAEKQKEIDAKLTPYQTVISKLNSYLDLYQKPGDMNDPFLKLLEEAAKLDETASDAEIQPYLERADALIKQLSPEEIDKAEKRKLEISGKDLENKKKRLDITGKVLDNQKKQIGIKIEGEKLAASKKTVEKLTRQIEAIDKDIKRKEDAGASNAELMTLKIDKMKLDGERIKANMIANQNKNKEKRIADRKKEVIDARSKLSKLEDVLYVDNIQVDETGAPQYFTVDSDGFKNYIPPGPELESLKEQQKNIDEYRTTLKSVIGPGIENPDSFSGKRVTNKAGYPYEPGTLLLDQKFNILYRVDSTGMLFPADKNFEVINAGKN